MVQHFQNFLVCPRCFSVDGSALELSQVDRADVAGAEAVDESEVRERDLARGGCGSGAADCVPAGIAGGSVGLCGCGGDGGAEVADGGGSGSPGCLGAGAGGGESDGSQSPESGRKSCCETDRAGTDETEMCRSQETRRKTGWAMIGRYV
ncbi:hypothetical protein CsSME_00040055 [Camellia sinensis var. sinensis]